jgi:hypothetical protein
MRINELLEGKSDQTAEIAIQRRIKLLRAVINSFDTLVQAHGYNTAVTKASEAIHDSESLDWMLKGSISGNIKLEKSFNLLVQLRQAIADRIKSGL